MPDKIDIVTTINSADEPITLSEVAKKLHTTASSMGQQILRLKKEGLLDETDTNHYVLSDKGKQWLQSEVDKAAKVLKSTVPAAGMGDRKKPETTGRRASGWRRGYCRRHPSGGKSEDAGAGPEH